MTRFKRFATSIVIVVLLTSATAQQQQPAAAGEPERPFVRFQTFPAPPQSFQQISFFAPLSPQQQQQANSQQEFRFPPQFVLSQNFRPQQQQTPANTQKPIVQFHLQQHQFQPAQQFQFLQQPEQNQPPQQQRRPSFQLQFPEQGKPQPAQQPAQQPVPQPAPKPAPQPQPQPSQRPSPQPLAFERPSPQPARPSPQLATFDRPSQPAELERPSAQPSPPSFVLQSGRVDQNQLEKRPFVGSPLISVEGKDSAAPSRFQPVPISPNQLQSLSETADENNSRDGRQLRNRQRNQEIPAIQADFQIPRRVPSVRNQENPNSVPVVVDITTPSVPPARGTARFTLPPTTEQPEKPNFPLDPNLPRLRHPVFPQRTPVTTTARNVPLPPRPVRPTEVPLTTPGSNTATRFGPRQPEVEAEVGIRVPLREEVPITPPAEEVRIRPEGDHQPEEISFHTEGEEELGLAEEDYHEELPGEEHLQAEENPQKDLAIEEHHPVEETPEVPSEVLVLQPEVHEVGGDHHEEPTKVPEEPDEALDLAPETEVHSVQPAEAAHTEPLLPVEVPVEDHPLEVPTEEVVPVEPPREVTAHHETIAEHHVSEEHAAKDLQSNTVTPVPEGLDDVELTESAAEVSVSVSMSVSSVTQPIPTSRQPEPPATEAPNAEDALEKPKFEIFNLGTNTSKPIDVSKVIFLPNLDLLRPTPRSAGLVVSSVQTSRSVTAVQVSSEQATESVANQRQTEVSISTSDRQSKAIESTLRKEQVLESKLPNKEPDADNLSQEEKSDSTESIIDKLDRVQSTLSDAFLTNGFHIKQPSGASNRTVANQQLKEQSSKPVNSLGDRPRRPFDVLSKLRTTTLGTTTTITTTTTTTTTETPTTTESTTTTTTTTTAKPPLPPISVLDKLLFKVAKHDDISAFLPPGYSPPAESSSEAPVPETTTPAPVVETTTAKSSSLLDKLLGGVKQDDISSFLPPGFKLPPPEEAPVETTVSSTTTTTTEPSTTTAGKKKSAIESLFEAAVLDDVSGLVPSNFKYKLFGSSGSTASTTKAPESESSSTTASPSGDDTTKKWLVFPTRSGGPARVTTEKPKAQAPPASIVTIKSGWPVRSTTEFTGWPSPATPEYVPPPSTSSTARPTTSTTTRATTTTTPRVTTPGLCGSHCRLAATIRLTDGIEWVPEFSDHNTREFANLANMIEKKLTEAYESGPLAPWFAGLEIEAFSRGSILVDYYLYLNGTEDLDTGDVRNYFHLSLQKSDDGYHLDQFTVDPKSTDFIVSRVPQQVQSDQEKVTAGGVSDWVVAIIVIGMASLLFVIAFGTTVLVKRRRDIKKRNTGVPLTEEMLNELNKNHMGGVDNPGNDFYDVGDLWDNRSYTRKPVKPSYQRPASVAALRTYAGAGYSGYNNFRPPLHDSWKSEWNGYMYNAHYNLGGAAGTGPRPSRYGRHSAAAIGRPRPSTYDFDDF